VTQTIILASQKQRDLAKQIIDAAGVGFVVRISEPKRSLEANALMWALLSDISRAKPDGRRHTPEVWKALFMSACGHEVQFAAGLDGNPFPVGFRSSRLSVRQMADLITFIIAWGDERGVAWSDRPAPGELQRAAG
jgi:hypothetical protein